MHLIKSATLNPVEQSTMRGGTSPVGVLSGLFRLTALWWKRRRSEALRNKAKRQIFLVESLVLGPKQRVVLLRCGDERFLVGTGAEGIQSIVPVAAERQSVSPTLRSTDETQWG